MYVHRITYLVGRGRIPVALLGQGRGGLCDGFSIDRIECPVSSAAPAGKGGELITCCLPHELHRFLSDRHRGPHSASVDESVPAPVPVPVQVQVQVQVPVLELVQARGRGQF